MFDRCVGYFVSPKYSKDNWETSGNCLHKLGLRYVWKLFIC